jgi:selenocysteine lyase/cysteine desulfurase
MTGAVLKFQRILGLKVPEKAAQYLEFPDEERPVVFITHMEHHSNQTSWLETLAIVELIRATPEGLVDLEHLDVLIKKHKGRKQLIASVTGCSNVTGIETPYHEIAKKMHKVGGLCFVDFACSGPYVEIDMHPNNDPNASLDAIFFSPHKFLGGPGTPGVLIFNKKLYQNRVPDGPGGGTVTFTNPWGVHYYIEDIETREDGGTPGFLQTIKAALCIKLKEEMGVENIRNREHEIVAKIFKTFDQIDGLKVMAGNVKDRLGVISYNIEGLHYNLGVKLLNDYFGIQTRGGCACAGTYGHFLLEIDEIHSVELMHNLKNGGNVLRPGWIRMSIHPTMTDKEVDFLCEATKLLAENWKNWSEDYVYDPNTNEFAHKTFKGEESETISNWFLKSLSN